MTLKHTLPLLLAAFLGSAAAQAPLDTTSRLVVKYRTPAVAVQSAAGGSERAKALSMRAKVGLAHVKTLASGATVYDLGKSVSLKEAREVALRLARDPEVAYAAPDVRVRVMAVPNDSYTSLQWSLREPSHAVGGANLFDAWPLAGTNKIVVAVVDTGSVPHNDLSSNELAGYDFITDPAIGGDGGGRDADPSDPGDFCASSGTSSSWHGLKVASQIAAIANNGSAIAGGAAYNATILQVRALGRCGGYLSDVADALMWSAGGSITGVPANATPARVVNMSLGSAAGTECFAYMQDAVDFAVTRRTVVVAAAGNDGANVVGAPANCSGVIAVGAHTHSGDLAGYSNRASHVTLTAPGGGLCARQTTTCVSTSTIALSNLGTSSPAGQADAVYFSGTSAATPHVAAAVALMLAANTDLTPAQVRSLLVSSARPHPADSFCAVNANRCGAGMLDAAAAVALVATPTPPPTLAVVGPSAAVAGGASVELRVTASGGAAPYTYAWRQTAGPSVSLTGAASAIARFTAPARKGADMVFAVTVTANNGAVSSDTVTVRVNNIPAVTAPTTLQFTAGTTFTLALSATDADGDDLTYVLVDGPAGASVSGNTLTWETPTTGTHVFEVQAIDESGATSAVHTLTLTVAEPTTGGGSGGGGTSGGGSGGGGGSLPMAGLLFLAFAAAVRRLQQR